MITGVEACCSLSKPIRKKADAFSLWRGHTPNKISGSGGKASKFGRDNASATSNNRLDQA